MQKCLRATNVSNFKPAFIASTASCLKTVCTAQFLSECCIGIRFVHGIHTNTAGNEIKVTSLAPILR